MRARSEYLTPGYLASSSVDTPDPEALCYYGQQVVIHYRVPAAYFCEGVSVMLSLRYGNGCIECFHFPLTHRRGYLIHRLVRDQFWDRDGIASFKVELVSEGEVVALKESHLWVESVFD